MPYSEQTLRAAAVACWENAQSLAAKAKLLAKHEYGARAVALAILGLEEFAKVIGYAVAALSGEPDEVLVEKLRHLGSHEAKHLIAQAAEYAQVVTQDWLDGVEWETGYRPSSEERLAAQIGQLAGRGLAHLPETPDDAKKFFKKLRRMPALFPGDDSNDLLDPDKKNAALYVDLTPDGRLRTPDRVADKAASEIAGLEWMFEEYAGLPAILRDDGAWRRLAAAIRS